MRHLNSVKQLGRRDDHRRVLINNLATSLFEHERIITTKEKAKVLKSYSEKLITRAKRNIELGESAEDQARKLHNKREVMKKIKDRDVVAKLFDDIALRNKERNGGYTRIYLYKRRPGDNAEQVIIELVEKKSAVAEKK